MKIFPAIDLYGGAAVRLFQGDYRQMTVYSREPEAVARQMREQGADCLHLVDLEGARSGEALQLPVVERIIREGGLFTEVGGGIRTLETVERYLSIGAGRVILGTAAVRDPAFLQEAVARYGDKIAVGADCRDGQVAVQGWTEAAGCSLEDFCRQLESVGVKTLICTDISRDGALQGSNRQLYAKLADSCSMQLVASGGVSTLEDLKALAELGLYGAIIGKAYYTGAIDLRKALEVAG